MYIIREALPRPLPPLYDQYATVGNACAPDIYADVRVLLLDHCLHRSLQHVGPRQMVSKVTHTEKGAEKENCLFSG